MPAAEGRWLWQPTQSGVGHFSLPDAGFNAPYLRQIQVAAQTAPLTIANGPARQTPRRR